MENMNQRSSRSGRKPTREEQSPRHPYKRIRTALSPVDNPAFSSRREHILQIEKTINCGNGSNAHLSVNEGSAFSDVQQSPISLKNVTQENTHLSVGHSTPKRSLLSSLSSASPQKMGSEDFVESPLKRCLMSVGIESVHRNLVKLGKGTFGTVVLGCWQGRRVAVKVIGAEGTHQSKSGRRESIECELNAMKLDHLNIVKIYATFQSETDVERSMVVMEYVGLSSLQNVIEEYFHLLTSEFSHRCLCQISSALVHCHERNIVHLDVKPSNVLVSSSGVCKLADFGCSKDLYKMEKEHLVSAARTRKKSVPVGTPGFMAPELLLCVDPSPKSDVFSFGIFMWQLLAQERMPFPGLHMHTIMFKVVSESYRPDESLNIDVPKILKDLYKCCWAQRPEARPTMSYVTKVLSQFKLSSSEAKEKKRPASLRLLR